MAIPLFIYKQQYSLLPQTAIGAQYRQIFPFFNRDNIDLVCEILNFFHIMMTDSIPFLFYTLFWTGKKC